MRGGSPVSGQRHYLLKNTIIIKLYLHFSLIISLYYASERLTHKNNFAEV